MANKLLIGVCCSMISSALSSLGQVLMKYAHNQSLGGNNQKDIPYIANPKWLLAFSIYTIGQVLNVVCI